MKLLILVFLNIQLFFIPSNVHAQRYQLFPFTYNNGLSSYNAQTICQDKHGYIWIGTQDGLNRFNGKDFVIFNKTTRPRLSGNDIRYVNYDKVNNCLWVCSSNGGVDAIDPDNDTIIFRLGIDTIKKYLTDPSVQKVELIQENILCLNTPSGLLFYDLKNKRIITGITQPFLKNDQPKKFVNGLFTDKNFLYTITIGEGISVYNTRTLKLLHEHLFDTEFAGSLIYRCWFDTLYHTIFICSSKGLYAYSPETNVINKIQLTKKQLPVYAICRKNDISMILATSEGVFETNNNFTNLNHLSFTNEEGIENWDINVNEIFIGIGNEIWYAARKGLMLQMPQISPFEKYSVDPHSNIKLNHLYYLMFLNKETVLACDLNKTYRINLTTGSIEPIKPFGFYYYFFEDSEKRKFISKEDGLFFTKQFEKPVLIAAGKICPELSHIEKYKFNSHLNLNDSIVVLAAEEDKGVFVWNTRAKTVNSLLKASNKFESKYCNGLAKVSSSRFLIVTDSELALYDVNKKTLKKVTIKNKENEEQRLFLDVAKINNEYWVASYGSGIFILDTLFNQKAFISAPEGLSNNSVYKMIPDNCNNVWITTNYGLNRIDATSHKVKSYFINDGLHNNAFEEFSANSNGGTIIVGGPNGLTKIDPDKLYKHNAPNACLFEYIVMDDGTTNQQKIQLINKNSITIPNNIYKADINVISINYDLTSDLNYYYRIKELGNNWFFLGGKNTVSLLGVRPGTYHLQVKAANEDGVWSEPKELILIFLPKWYQTWWFYLLIALTIAGILYALYRYRINQIKKQHAIRKNIATDLHDDLGSTLNSVKVFTNLAISGVKQEESLQQVKDNLTEATMSLRDMIWVLDDSLDTVDELITRLKQFAIPVAAASSIEAIIKADSDVNSRQLTKEEKRNLFLICKEAINNSIKYSCASQIDVSITASGKKIQIVIADNGKGFNVDEVKKGYGLKNMQYRARQINYNISLVSSLGKGTKFQINPGR